jgi:hypothetical protein
MLFWETAAVYCENRREHTNTLCGQNAEFWYDKIGSTDSNHWASTYCLTSAAAGLPPILVEILIFMAMQIHRKKVNTREELMEPIHIKMLGSGDLV